MSARDQGVALDRLRRDWTPALLAYLSRRQEAGLGSAYDLGRGAVADGLGILDVLAVHHAVVVDVLRTARDVHEPPELVEGAAQFLLEALAPFEMTRRAYLEQSGA